MMDYRTLVARICADGREAAAADYADPRHADKLEGAAQGFLEAGLTETPDELATLLNEARQRMVAAHRERDDRYWFWRCREAEIEWTANVVSAVLANAGLPVIVPPTARGLMKAAEILGIAA